MSLYMAARVHTHKMLYVFSTEILFYLLPQLLDTSSSFAFLKHGRGEASECLARCLVKLKGCEHTNV